MAKGDAEDVVHCTANDVTIWSSTSQLAHLAQ